MLRHDAFGDRKPKAGALRIEPRGHECFEKIGQQIARNPGAIVEYHAAYPVLTAAVQESGFNPNRATT